MTGSVAPLPMLDIDAARRLTERIRYCALGVRDGMEKLQSLVTQAQEGQAHVALGFKSWTAYLAETLGDTPLRLPRDQRQELVGYLAGEGMSTRAIAPIVGASQKTVARDVRATESNDSVDSPVTNSVNSVTSKSEVRVSPIRPAILTSSPAHAGLPSKLVATPDRSGKPRFLPEETSPRPATVTSLDGRQRPATQPPRTPPRRPLPDAFFDAAYDLTKTVERVVRLTEDDRFPQNAEKVATKHRSDLIRARDALQGVIDQLIST